MKTKTLYIVYNKEFTDIEEAKIYEETLKNKLELRARNLYLFYVEMRNYPGEDTAFELIRNFTKNRKFTFGQYKDEYIGDIIIKDTAYVKWCIKNIKSFSLNKEEEIMLKIDKGYVISCATTNMATYETTYTRDRCDFKLINWEKTLIKNK